MLGGKNRVRPVNMRRNKHGFGHKLRHQARNIVVAFFAIVICLSSSSLWLNQRHKAPAQTVANTVDDGTEADTQQDESNDQDSSDTMASAQDDSGVLAAEQMATAQQDGGLIPESVSAESLGVDGTEASQSPSDSDGASQDSPATSAPESYLKPAESIDVFVTDARKTSDNRLIIGADNLPDNLL